MIDVKKINFDQLPKKLCDGAIGAFNKDLFFLALTSGSNLDSFAVTPRTMKDIAVFMNKHIAKYESQFGVIDMSLPPIVSPIQNSDLGDMGGGDK